MVGALSAALLTGALASWATGAGGGWGSSAATTGTGGLEATAPAAAGDTGRVAPTSSAARTRTTRPSTVVARPAIVAPEVVTTPTRLEIPRIGLSMPVEPVTVAGDGQMALPSSATVAGWYRYGPAPGSRAGASVIAGHVDTPAEGVGPMAGLAALHAGDGVEVRSGARRQRYRVESVQVIRKSTLDLPVLFDRSGPPRLHLVTCGGPYDRAAHHYEDNVVVVATPLAGA